MNVAVVAWGEQLPFLSIPAGAEERHQHYLRRRIGLATGAATEVAIETGIEMSRRRSPPFPQTDCSTRTARQTPTA